MERMGKAWDFSSYLVEKFLKDEKRMRKEWERMGKKRARNWMEMMGNEWEINGKKRELLGRKWESRWRICEFALFEKFEDIWVCPVTCIKCLTSNAIYVTIAERRLITWKRP